MRPVIVRALNEWFGTNVFSWLVPDLALVYTTAIAVCLWVFIRRAKSEGLSEYHALGAALCGSLSGILGVRIWYLVANLGAVFQNPSMLLELNGPTVSFGGYILGAIGFATYLKLNKQETLRYLDISASCLGLGPMVARWACFLNGDDYGSVSHVPWAVSYPPGSYPFVDHVNRGLINVMADRSLPVHPVQLYLSAKGLLLFVICSWLWKRHRLPAGNLFIIFWLLYGLLRFTLEYFRGDQQEVIFGYFTTGQVVCLMIAVVSTLFLLHSYTMGGEGVRTRLHPTMDKIS